MGEHIFKERGSLMGIVRELEGVGPIRTTNASQDLDCETAALLRAAIRPLFSNAASWAGLADILKEKGYRLAFQNGRLCITDRTTGERVCGIRFLGFELDDLVERMGRPIVVARGGQADGDLLLTRPVAGSA